jgi:hypothetical protein
MFRWFKKIFTPKVVSQKKLAAISDKKKKKEWEKILDKLAAHAVTMAEQGRTFLIIRQELLMNEYNNTRTKDQILVDVKKRFPNCECYFDVTVTGQENIRISWEKRLMVK